jgi:5-methylcytosine-specific restriction endonuclease McrA
MGPDMLSTSVLVLNKNYFPVHVTTLRRAFVMLYAGIAKAIDKEYHTFDFQSWSELSVAAHDESVGLVGRIMRVPRVIVLVAYDHLPKRGIRFSRINILLRDKHTCQYCNRRLPRNQLNLDHVTPRSKGGMTTWENVVTSCHACNRKKGGRTPKEAGMKLLHTPFKPASVPFLDLSIHSVRYEEWKPFFNFIDFSYWNAELEP